MGRRILLLAVVACAPPCMRAAGDYPIDRATLKGLSVVGVVVDTIDPQVENAGVTRDLLLSGMLKRLSADRVKVDPSAKEFLGLRINAVRSGRSFALSMTIGLYQPVLLSRDREIRTSTQTWEVESVLLADSKILLSACNDSAGDLIDRFATAFHTVNRE